MRWYFASRTKHRKLIEDIVALLTSQNHSVVYDWSKINLLIPYHDHSEKSSLVADEIGIALKNVDVFVLITDEAGTDMFVELGIMIGRWMNEPTKKIYAVGKFNNRSLMHFHPAIKRVNKLSDVFLLECPELFTGDGTSQISSFDRSIA